ncbi:MAG: sensory box protein [Verrucomicrobiales bacterium]|nr:sensory box protein [Verrucomicrobiales bacterium]
MNLRLLSGFLIALVLLVTVGFFSWRNTVILMESQNSVASTHEVLTDLDDLQRQLDAAEAGQRGYLLTGEDSFLLPYRSALTPIKERVLDLRKLTKENPIQQRNLDILEPLIAQRLDILKQRIISRQTDSLGAFQTPQVLHEGEAVMNQIREITNRMESEENRLLQSRNTVARQNFRNATGIVVVAGFASLLILSLTFTLLVRENLTRQKSEKAFQASEVRFRSLVENVRDYAIFMLDPKGVIMTWNAGAERHKGYRAEEIIGKHFSIFYPPEDVEAGKPERELEVAAETGRVEDEGWRVRKNGTRFWANVVVTALRDKNGELLGFSKITRDMTERKQAEEKLRESQERTRLIVESAHDAFIGMDAGGKIIDWNRQAEIIFGYSSEEAIGLTLADAIIPVRYREAHRNGLQRFMETGQGPVLNKRIELSASRRNGEEFPVEITIVPIRWHGGFLFAAFLRDVTERKQAEEQLKNTALELGRSNAELEQFAYVASHDLQEPLRAVSGCVQILQQRYKDSLDSKATDLIQHAVDGSLRMQTLIHDLLSYSRVSSKAQPLETVDSATALNSALLNLKSAVEESHAEVVFNGLPSVKADPVQLSQLFQNLVGNALKYRGEQNPKIRIEAEPENKHQWRFAIRDNGIGIEPQYYERIFRLFQRLHTRREYTGTGIGLALCKKIVERHGGSIWVESQPEKGSTFFFTLPATKTI